MDHGATFLNLFFVLTRYHILVLLLDHFLIELGVLESGIARSECLHKLVHGLSHMFVEGLLLCIHLFHILLRHLNLSARIFDILIIFTRMMLLLPLVGTFLLLLHLHILRASFEQATKNIKSMAGTGATVFHRWNPTNIRMALHFLLLLERQILIKLCNIGNFLKLTGIALHLLLKVLNTLGYTLSNLEIMLNFLNRRADFSLLKCIFGQCLVRLFKFTNFFFLQINFSHLSMIICQFLIVVIVCWLLVLF